LPKNALIFQVIGQCTEQLSALYTVSGKNGTNNVLGITLTNTNV